MLKNYYLTFFYHSGIESFQIRSELLSFKMENEKQMKEISLIKDPEHHDHSHDMESVETDYADNPHVYNSTWEYIMSAMGVCVGFGSFWRFPSLIFRNGGGAFLIPYLISVVLLGIPLLYLQTAVGQMHRVSIPQVFRKIHPSLKVLGLGIMNTTLIFSSVYNVLLTYCYRFLFTSFEYPLPFANESITENRYFHDQILHQSSSINQFGGISFVLFIIFIGSLLICHWIIKDGAKTSGKIMIVTATAPFVIFFLLILRGLFLQGAWEGIVYLFKPNWSLIFTPSIWIDATTQVFYQLSIGMGTIINISSQKARRDDIIKSVILVPIGLVLCGILSALTIFIYLSHFCLINGLTIGDPSLNISGFQLSFNVLPKALMLLPLPNLWVFIFFTAMILLGIDSQFGTIEGIYCCIRDQWRHGSKRLFGITIDQKKAQYCIIFLLCLGAFTLTSSAGIYYLDFYDYFMSNIPFSLWALLQVYFFVHVFKFRELTASIKRYTKQQTPWIVQYCLQSYWLPGLLVANIFFATINQLFIFRKFSFGFYLFGWFITLYPLAYIYYRLRREWKGWQKLKLTFLTLQQ